MWQSHPRVSDITYIRTAQGWLYLGVVLDLYSRKVVGWSMAPIQVGFMAGAAVADIGHILARVTASTR